MFYIVIILAISAIVLLYMYITEMLYRRRLAKKYPGVPFHIADFKERTFANKIKPNEPTT